MFHRLFTSQIDLHCTYNFRYFNSLVCHNCKFGTAGILLHYRQLVQLPSESSSGIFIPIKLEDN
ncbi:unnamed protein product [Phyllotreta striolata]|uniref:Uncharacterized protein n=1 Tax=Phyllotreta striolata TaxID=444603 RepID=A0A9N9TN27_PHYSR|nr:unnamed protein product [Phyllotreta striolata]